MQLEDSVLLAGNFLSASRHGTRGVCEDLATRLGAKGWRVVTTSDKPERLSRLLDMTATAWGSRRDYGVAQVDVYSGHAFLLAEAVCWILRRAGKPYTLALRGGDLPSYARRWPGRVRRLLGSAQVVTTPSSYLLEQLVPYRADLRLLPNPLDLSSYTFRLREQPGPRLVWLRAFHAIYNPSLAPRVLAELSQDFPGLHLTMIGPDKGDGSLQAAQLTARELGVGGRITWIEGVPKDEVPGRLNEGDIFLNTANVDNTPVSVMEAMACGLCVVSTNVGGIPYLLEDGADSLLVPAGDADAMAAAVRRVLTEQDLPARLSTNAHTKAAQWDWSLILPRWETLLRDVMSRRANVWSD
jgi:glycosyltransferase involved in cell wall biosynthesis